MASNNSSLHEKFLKTARKAILSNRWPDVEQACRQAFKLTPSHPEINFYLGQCAVRRNMLDVAIKHFQVAHKVAPTNAALNSALADALHMMGDLEEAIKHYQITLREKANDPQTLNSLGVALSKAQRHQEAILHLQRAITVAPQTVQTYNNLGNAFKLAGKNDDAIATYRKALEQNPGFASAHFNLGLLLQTDDTLEESAEHLYQACQLRPDMTDAFVALGETLRRQRRLDESLECFVRARKMAPHSVDVENGEGLTYLELNRPNEAIKRFEKALSLAPDNAKVYGLLARAWFENGDHPKGIAFSRKQLELDPRKTGVYYEIALSKKAKLEDMSLVEEIENCLKAMRGKDEKDEINLHFALGKLYDDLHLWDQAFDHFAKGNEMANALQTPSYSKSEEAEFLKRLIASFTPNIYQSLSAIGDKSTRPICIVGMPRSGTTLIEQIISSHPKVAAAGEVSFWGSTRNILQHLIGTNSTYPECISELSATHVQNIAQKYLGILDKIAGPTKSQQYITDKMPHNFMHLGLIALTFPNVRFVHCRRDPMDNCLSIFSHYFRGKHSYAYNQTNLGTHYKHYERLMEHWHTVLPGRIFDIQYENLIADPEYWSRKLIDHVGLEWDDTCLAPHKLERAVKTASHWQVRQPIYKTSVQRWKHYEKSLNPLKQALD